MYRNWYLHVRWKISSKLIYILFDDIKVSFLCFIHNKKDIAVTFMAMQVLNFIECMSIGLNHLTVWIFYHSFKTFIDLNCLYSDHDHKENCHILFGLFLIYFWTHLIHIIVIFVSIYNQINKKVIYRVKYSKCCAERLSNIMLNKL